MKFENVRVYNFEGAFRGMRNPKNSWALSDSVFGISGSDEFYGVVFTDFMQSLENGSDMELHRYYLTNGEINNSNQAIEYALIGPKDMKLAQTLIAGGSEHRKFLRQIGVCVDITAPLYWWKEFDTYNVGTVANSTSTMHKLTSKPITMDCFETDDYNADVCGDNVLKTVEWLESLRLKYIETNDKKYWKELVRWLSESWLQTRTVTMNYENLLSIYHQRKNHKLNEWSGKDNPSKPNFMSFIDSLPYANDLIKFSKDTL